MRRLFVSEVMVESVEKHFDAAVVGLGAAGCWAAKVLTENGLSVVALDAGRLLSPADLPRDIKPLSKRVRPASYWHKLLFGHRTTQARATSFHPQLEHLYVDDKQNPYSTRGGDTFLWIRGRQVGGRLHTWARMALRLSDRDFKRAESDGYGTPWPISYSDLAEHYCRVETFHGLCGSHDGLPHLPDGCVSKQGVFTAQAALFKSRIEARWPERRVILPRILKDNIEPIHAPLEQALETNRLQLITEAPVARLLLNSEGSRAIGVEFIDANTGRRSEVNADRVFLCASAIESVRILLNSRCPRHPEGVGNNHGLLGRYILDHNFVVGAGTAGEEYQQLPWVPRPSTPLDLSTDLDFCIPDFSSSLKDREFVRGFGMQGTVSPTHWAIAAFGEMLPHPDNRVTLSGKMDAFGIPAVNISIRRHENDRKMIEAQKRELLLMAQSAGLQLNMPLPAALRGMLWRAVGPEVGVLHLGLAIHECGGARMGKTPEVSVVNANNQVWDVPNVYVTDGACFPNTGCQNPTLTIMALTARACELAAADRSPAQSMLRTGSAAT
ncbi:MAG TPA: GMC family oxidoreductase [Bryobacteraceae bacterium]|nr:GMC family oxidoreductase [Bryobacteraceae bacterium]